MDMTIVEYIEFNNYCIRALKMLCSNNQLSDIEIKNISHKYWKSIIQEIVDTGAGEKTSDGFILKKNAEGMLSSLYYEKKIMELTLLKSKDAREERMTKISEISANSAKWASIWAALSAIAAFGSLLLIFL